LQAPHEEADAIIKERFPVPRLVVCDQYGSQVITILSFSLRVFNTLHALEISLHICLWKLQTFFSNWIRFTNSPYFQFGTSGSNFS
jgi:hypothetical protein